MKIEEVEVSYRDKVNAKNISLGKITLELPETVTEAVAKFGEEDLIEYANKAFVIDQQREFRDANRPDRTKTQSAVAKFKQLSPEKQAELLRAAGMLGEEETSTTPVTPAAGAVVG